MKNLLTVLVLIFTLNSWAIGQCVTIVPSSGGDVVIELQIIEINAPASCNNGYVFTPVIEYNITTPVGLYTLQGVVTCNDGSSFFQLPNNGGSGTSEGANTWTPETNCASATPRLLGCLEIDLRINGPGIPNQVINISCEGILPIQLLSFDVENNDRNTSITWQTGEETESIFSIQHSTDAMNWRSIATMSNKGSYSTYQYNHYEVSTGTHYYRLKNVDNDGVEEVFGIRKVFIGEINKMNFTHNVLYLSYESRTSVVIVNSIGVQVASFDGKQGEVDLNGVAAGLYFVINTENNDVDKIIIN